MLALLLILAPAPAAPPLTEAYLVGNWTYRWGGWIGCVTLRADGTLIGHDWYEHGPVGYEGRWKVERGDLVVSLGGTNFPHRIEVGRVPVRAYFAGSYCDRPVFFRRQTE